MKLIKLTTLNNEVKYFSSQKECAEYFNAATNRISEAVNKRRPYKHCLIEIIDAGTLTIPCSEVDPNKRGERYLGIK